VADMYPLPKEETVTYAGVKTFKFTPVANDLLIFRSNVMHMVNQNKSDRDRVSISINFTF
jgi:ectoine hydroxylase-related dioxygenase (phytanoyl-CoA dioxygenase family)